MVEEYRTIDGNVFRVTHEVIDDEMIMKVYKDDKVQLEIFGDFDTYEENQMISLSLQ